MSKTPVIDIGECTKCESCIEICPGVFGRNSETGFIEVIELPEFPEDCVIEAISICPADCITWDSI